SLTDVRAAGWTWGSSWLGQVNFGIEVGQPSSDGPCNFMVIARVAPCDSHRGLLGLHNGLCLLYRFFDDVDPLTGPEDRPGNILGIVPIINGLGKPVREHAARIGHGCAPAYMSLARCWPSQGVLPLSFKVMPCAGRRPLPEIRNSVARNEERQTQAAR